MVYKKSGKLVHHYSVGPGLSLINCFLRDLARRRSVAEIQSFCLLYFFSFFLYLSFFQSMSNHLFFLLSQTEKKICMQKFLSYLSLSLSFPPSNNLYFYYLIQIQKSPCQLFLLSVTVRVYNCKETYTDCLFVCL